MSLFFEKKKSVASSPTRSQEDLPMRVLETPGAARRIPLIQRNELFCCGYLKRI